MVASLAFTQGQIQNVEMDGAKTPQPSSLKKAYKNANVWMQKPFEANQFLMYI